MKVLIIEDEMMARRSLEKMLENKFPDIEVVGECASVSESVARLKERPDEADLIFMDVELSDGECFEIFRQVAVKPRVVMTTAYDSYAVKAFEAGSIDYLLKPIDMSALKRAVERCSTVFLRRVGCREDSRRDLAEGFRTRVQGAFSGAVQRQDRAREG